MKINDFRANYTDTEEVQYLFRGTAFEVTTGHNPAIFVKLGNIMHLHDGNRVTKALILDTTTWEVEEVKHDLLVRQLDAEMTVRRRDGV